jgi:hypothetical protein
MLSLLLVPARRMLLLPVPRAPLLLPLLLLLLLLLLAPPLFLRRHRGLRARGPVPQAAPHRGAEVARRRLGQQRGELEPLLWRQDVGGGHY